jgi:hypothetical protein
MAVVEWAFRHLSHITFAVTRNAKVGEEAGNSAFRMGQPIRVEHRGLRSTNGGNAIDVNGSTVALAAMAIASIDTAK